MEREEDEKPLWTVPSCRWRFYGPLLYESSSYAEFAAKAVALGLVDPDPDRRYDELIDLCCRREPYEEFIYEEACSRRGSGKMNAKARKLRDEMMEIEISLGERNLDGTARKTGFLTEIPDWAKGFRKPEPPLPPLASGSATEAKSRNGNGIIRA